MLERVDVVTLGRAACVNKLWRKMALDGRLWEPIVKRILFNMFGFNNNDKLEHLVEHTCGFYNNDEHSEEDYRSLFHSFYKSLRESSLSQNLDFYSIDFSKKIRPWR